MWDYFKTSRLPRQRRIHAREIPQAQKTHASLHEVIPGLPPPSSLGLAADSGFRIQGVVIRVEDVTCLLAVLVSLQIQGLKGLGFRLKA